MTYAKAMLFCSGVGFSVGVVASVILFRSECSHHTILSSHLIHSFAGRTWPIALSTGFGLGAAYADCDRSFNPARVPGTRLAVIPSTAAPTADQK